MILEQFLRCCVNVRVRARARDRSPSLILVSRNAISLTHLRVQIFA